ncbi:hypothetical protein HG531_013631 [Fusarium graminearum]|nr:hypothetical protein HG531_013631 [Fusarium graminearum]
MGIVPPQAWQDDSYRGRLGYIKATADVVNPLTDQENMIAQSGGSDKWITRILEGSGHSPMLSRPEELARLSSRHAGAEAVVKPIDGADIGNALVAKAVTAEHVERFLDWFADRCSTAIISQLPADVDSSASGPFFERSSFSFRNPALSGLSGVPVFDGDVCRNNPPFITARVLALS